MRIFESAASVLVGFVSQVIIVATLLI